MKGFGPVPEELRKTHLILSASKLLEFRKSPKHYYWKYIKKKKVTSDAMEKGTLIHMAVLEPQRFLSEYCIINEEKCPSYGNDQLKAFCKELELPLSGTKAELTARIKTKRTDFWTYEDEMARIIADQKKVIAQDDWDMCEEIVREITLKKLSGYFIPRAKKEVEGYFSPMPGVIIVFKIDAWGELNERQGILCDVKTSRDVSKEYVERKNYWDGRHVQLGIYCDALSNITGLNFDDSSYFLFVENMAPYCVAEYHCDIGMLEAGRSEYKHLIKELVKCHETNQWRSSQTEVETTSLKPWDFERIPVFEEDHV